MSESLAVILGRVPERLSQYSMALRARTSQVLFFSSVASLLGRWFPSPPKLIVIDNVDGDIDAVSVVKALRQTDEYNSTVILVVVSDGDANVGVAAIEAGASDYLPAAQVRRELPIRVWMHWNNNLKKVNTPAEASSEFVDILPLEDRLIIQAAVQSMRLHMASIATVGDLAQYVGRTEKDINKAFVQHFGQTAFSYMRAYKINKAKELLTRTRLPVAELAQEVGYLNPANFATAFKSVVGLSPTQYRAQTLTE